MTYEEVLNFLFSQLPMYQRVGKTAFKKDLSNTIALCEALGYPERQFKSIHIAGTNGKGSTAHMIAGILQQSGMKVGLYTSPHYKDYRERIKINGRYISKNEVIDFVEHQRATIESIRPSFFEMTVGMAFDHFARHKVDIAVIETGLGGRLDSTNVINPLISVITNIGLDHQAILGDTIPLIAGEKAGIIKPNTPVIIGKYQEETDPVFKERTAACNTEMQYAKDLVALKTLRQSVLETALEAKLDDLKSWIPLTIPTGVPYNVENARTAIACIVKLKSEELIQISNEEIVVGITQFDKATKYIGRWQVKSTKPLVLLDAAHNVDGLGILLKKIRELDHAHKHIILGMVNDKDVTKTLVLLPKDARYYFVKPDVPRGRDRYELQQEARNHGLKGKAYKSCKHALRAAKRAAESNDIILATGSSFVVAELV